MRSVAGGGTIELVDNNGDGHDDGPPVVCFKEKPSRIEAEAIRPQLVDAGATVEVK